MKKLLFGLAGIALAFFLGACSTAQQQDAAQRAATLQNLLNQGCAVVQPTLASIALIDPQLAPFQVANGVFCSTVANVNTASVQELINTAIPAAEKLVVGSTLLDDNQKKLAIGSFAAFQVFLGQIQFVLSQGAVATPTTPASAPVGASQ